MVIKQRRAAPKVAETAPSYKARSSKTGSLGEALWKIFQKLPEDEQSSFLHRLLGDPDWFEDIYDSISIRESDKEPSSPFEDFVAELERERAR